MKYKKIYAVMTRNPFNGTHLSQEVYETLAAAQKFCESRSDTPRKVTEYRYESPIIIYTIHELRSEFSRKVGALDDMLISRSYSKMPLY